MDLKVILSAVSYHHFGEDAFSEELVDICSLCVCFCNIGCYDELITCEAAPLVLYLTEINNNIMFLRQMFKTNPYLIKNKQKGNIAVLNLSITLFRRMWSEGTCVLILRSCSTTEISVVLT
jgi:hypothetical protein